MTYISACSSTNGNAAQLKQELIDKIDDYQLHPSYNLSQYEAQKKGKQPLIRESESPKLFAYFQGVPESHISLFINHWLLSRNLISEREIDLLSNTREDKSMAIKSRKSIIFPIASIFGHNS
jgi:hypothetical protein